MSAGQAREAGQQLALHGLRRLSGNELIVRARVLGRILTQSDTETCAAIVKGSAAPGLEAAIRKLSDGDLQEWLDLVFASTVAELEQRTAPKPPSSTRVNQALSSLSSRLSADDGDLLKQVLADPQATNDEQTCKAGRLLYGTLPDLSGDDQAVLARAFVTH